MKAKQKTIAILFGKEPTASREYYMEVIF